MKIFIFGSNGMLGNYVKSYLSQYYNICALTRNDYELSKLNINSLEQLLLNKTLEKNDIIINCAGVIPQASKQRSLNSKLYFTINSLFPVILSQICDKYGAKMIHITTDCVFSGKDGLYNELSEHDETNDYGMSKSLGELCNATIIRTSIIGEELTNKRSLLEWVKSNKDKEIYGFINHFWNGVTCLQLAKIIYKIINENLYWSGVRHIFSPRSVNKFELVSMINEIYNLDIKIIPFETEKIDKTITTIYDTNGLFDITDLKEQLKELVIYLKENKQQFFIIGCIRSGTTFLCDMFTDFVPKIYNETGERDIDLRYKLIGDENFAFKYCEDFNYIHTLKQKFKNCKIILIVRDMRDVVNSVFLPNIDSIPYRDFPAVKKLSFERNISKFESSLLIIDGYYENIYRMLTNHYDLIDDIIIYEDIISNPITLKNLFDKYFEEKKDIEYYKKKILKTPNQLSYLSWNEEQKKTFKNFNNGFLNKMLIHFKYEKFEDW